MQVEAYISSIVIRCEPENLALVAEELDRIDELELIPSEDSPATLIAVIDTPSSHRTLDIIDQARLMDGVYSVNLIYNHVEPSSALEESSEPHNEDNDNETLTQTVY